MARQNIIHKDNRRQKLKGDLTVALFFAVETQVSYFFI
jgi:hypothetical protein